MEKIENKHIIEAIQEIEQTGRNDRPSFKFELLHERKSYPPLLVVAIANRLAGGEELLPNSSSGGWKSEEFLLLKKLGFRVVEKVKQNEQEFIVSALSKFISKEDLAKFFELLNKLLTDLNLFTDDERLAITSREPHEQQVSVNINARLVLSLERLSGKNSVSFMISNSLAEKHKELWIGNKFVFQRNDDMVSVNVPTSKVKDIPVEIIDEWLAACKSYLPAQKSTQYRKFHNQLLYRLAFDSALLEQITKGIQPTSETSMGKNIWIEKTLIKKRLDRLQGENAMGQALWSPQTGSDGRDTYRNMRDVQEGDLVIHLVDNNRLIGCSVIAGPLEDDIMGIEGTEWAGKPAYRYPLKDYVKFDPPMSRDEFLANDDIRSQLLALLDENKGSGKLFFNRNLGLNQGSYLTNPPVELVQIWNTVYEKRYGKVLVDLSKYQIKEGIRSVVKNDFKHFDCDAFNKALLSAPLSIQESLSYRFTASLLAKRFLILTGLSGSGKTKLAQAFVRWISADDRQYEIVPVAADWTNREPLFGYPNALNSGEYVKPESGVLNLILRAIDKPEEPHFLILDEMNLSHVERYFADFLSGLESDEEIPLHKNDTIKDVPQKLQLPKNLFVIGTVNIDETTYMFSPKVLDRANVIEFRVSEDEIESFLANPAKPDLEKLDRKGISMAASFVSLATKELSYKDKTELNDALVAFFSQLKLSGAEFGYRTAYEMHRLAGALQELWPKYESWEVIDICIMQKLLPKVHGSRKKMEPILLAMAKLCVTESVDVKELFKKEKFERPKEDDDLLYPMSFEKLYRMYRGALDNGFTSFAEA